MARLELRPGLDTEIATRIGVPAVRRALDMLQDEARRRAPAVKVWVTMRDERVRESHMKADTQTVPVNLRFKLKRPSGAIDLARHPRDPNLPEDQRINCRCDDPVLPQLLADSIHSTDVTLNGNIAAGSVETRFPRAGESEVGTSQDEGAYFMTNALREVAARLAAGHSR